MNTQFYYLQVITDVPLTLVHNFNGLPRDIISTTFIMRLPAYIWMSQNYHDILWPR